MSRLTIPSARGLRAIRDAQKANFPHLWTQYIRTREVDPVTGKVTITWEEGEVLPCRMNPASAGGVNIAAGQAVIAGEWIVSFAWDAEGLREQDRGLVQHGSTSEKEFAEMVEIKRILLPTSAEVVTTVYANSVLLP